MGGSYATFLFCFGPFFFFFGNHDCSVYFGPGFYPPGLFRKNDGVSRPSRGVEETETGSRFPCLHFDSPEETLAATRGLRPTLQTSPSVGWLYRRYLDLNPTSRGSLTDPIDQASTDGALFTVEEKAPQTPWETTPKIKQNRTRGM